MPAPAAGISARLRAAQRALRVHGYHDDVAAIEDAIKVIHLRKAEEADAAIEKMRKANVEAQKATRENRAIKRHATNNLTRRIENQSAYIAKVNELLTQHGIPLPV